MELSTEGEAPPGEHRSDSVRSRNIGGGGLEPKAAKPNQQCAFVIWIMIGIHTRAINS